MRRLALKPYTHIIYHGPGCPDGFGAAFAAWKKLGETVKYMAMQPGEPTPALPADASVLMVDLSLPRERLQKLREEVKSVEILDHHVTAMKDLEGVEGAYFDMNHSGAYLSWEHFHGEPVPEFIGYLEDRDLWRFQLPHSREVSAAMGSYPQKFDVWEGLMTMGMDKLQIDGGAILRFQSQAVEHICRHSFMKEIDGHLVPVVNATCFKSEVGDRLCQIHPTAPFSAYFFDKEKIRCWGLRSPGRFDVSVIAKKFGGGGHPGAAGFTEEIVR